MTTSGGEASLYDLLHEAATLHQAGRLADAARLYRSILVTHPLNPDAHHNLGVLAMQEGRGLTVALPHFRQAWESNPSHQQYGLSYLKALHLAKHADEARRVHEDGIKRGFAWPPLPAMQQAGKQKDRPAPPEGWHKHAMRLFEAGMFPEALDAFAHAIVQQPNELESRLGHARTLAELHRHEEAERAFSKLLKLKADWPQALCGLASTLCELDRTAEAETCYRRALALDPANPDAYAGLGRILMESRRNAEAEDLCRSVLAHDPARFDVFYDLGTLLNKSGRLDEARQCYREVVALCPEHLDARTSLLFIEHYTAVQPSAALLDQSRSYGDLARSRANKPFRSWKCSHPPAPLRVGLVSGDLREHPVGYFLETLVANTDPGKVAWHAYPTTVQSDALSGRLRRHMATWNSLSGLSDADAARKIRDDGIHVLMDLAGHTVHNRLPLFAWKPAPAAVTWLGYFATTGVEQIDYILADRIGIPDSLQAQFTERVMYLPDTRLCFSVPEACPQVSPLPALQRGYVTFGCFQAQPKITDAMLHMWSQILAQCPGSRLRIQNAALSGVDGQNALRERLEAAGIGTTRVDLHGFSTRKHYLEAYGDVDMLLDTFPYPGGTTTCEALWMGVPTLTLCGETMIARQGASLLTAAGLTDWITHSEEEYIAHAVHQAGRTEYLADLRSSLREHVAASALFDAARFARGMEEALHRVWTETGRPRLRS